MRFATKQVCLTLLLVLPLFAMPAHAVRLAQGEPGQVAIVPLYHPAAMFYNRQLEDVLQKDFRTLTQFIA